jgi:hypothetical protein
MNDLDIIDSRMLELMAYAVRENLVKNESEYLTSIGFSRTNIGNIRRGHQSFSTDHIHNACVITGANANWLFGIEKNMLRKEEKDPVERLKQLSVEIEALLTKEKMKKKQVNKKGNKQVKN